jgi:hypothetical protein
MRLSHVLGLDVRSKKTGWSYGPVRDVRIAHEVQTDPNNRSGQVVSLIVGRPGLKERLFGRGNPDEHPHRAGGGSAIAWADVVHRDGQVLYVKEDGR